MRAKSVVGSAYRRATVHYDDLAGTESGLHQIEVGIGEVIGFARPTDEQILFCPLIHRVARGGGHYVPQIGSHKAGTNQIDAKWGKFDCERPRQRF